MEHGTDEKRKKFKFPKLKHDDTKESAFQTSARVSIQKRKIKCFKSENSLYSCDWNQL